MTLVELPSGKIELVKQGPVMFLQFNADCSECLPYCQAMCCRMRMAYGVELTDEEFQRLDGIEVKKDDKVLRVLPVKDGTSWDCRYLSDDSRCIVQDEKPSHCRDWHCSPKGNPNDPTIKRRDMGWMIMPTGVRSEDKK